VTEAEPWRAVKVLAEPLDCRCVFDVGAHQGDMTDLFVKLFPHATVVSFEPDPIAFEGLKRRFMHEPRVAAHNLALGETSGETHFHCGTARFTSSRFPRNTSGRRYYKSDYVMSEQFNVSMDTLDAFVTAESIAHINLLKLDTQGGEFDILSGAQKLLSRGAIDIIVTEFFCIPHYEQAPLLDEIWRLLRTRGYELFDLFPGPKGMNGQLRFGDAIFVSPAYRLQYLDAFPPEP
jgi:FkbM family methyltransferase